MRLEFTQLTVSNFRCFTAPQSLELGERAGLIYMGGRNEVEPRLGSNGASKSSTWGAFCWCIYGQTPNGLRNPDIKTWGSNKIPEVTVEINIDDNPHLITRKAETNGLTIDGEAVNSEAAAEFIGLPFDVFINTILLAQGQPLFFDLAPKAKLDLFSDVLQLDKWEDRSSHASTKLKELVTLEAELTGEFNGLQVALTQAQELLASAKQSSETWEEDRRNRVKRLADELKQKEGLLAQQAKKLADADLAHDGAATELKALRLQLPELQQAVADARSTLQLAQQELRNKDNERAKLKRELESLGTADKCPTCGQPITGTDLGKHKRELEKAIKKLFVVGDYESIKLMSSSLVKADAVWERAKTVADEFSRKADKAELELNFLRPQIAELKAQVNALKAGRTEGEEQRNPYNEQVQTLRRKVSQTEVDCDGLKEDLTKLSRRIERTRFWVKGFKDVRLYLLEEVLQELELATNATLAELGLESWQVNYSVEKETKSGSTQRGLNVTILSPHNKGPVKYESWSGGEGQRLRLIGALALSEVLLRHAGIQTNLEILDEPTRHLSSQGIEDLCAFLAERAKALGRQCFFIDHAAIESTAFADTITVVKTAKGTYFE